MRVGFAEEEPVNFKAGVDMHHHFCSGGHPSMVLNSSPKPSLLEDFPLKFIVSQKLVRNLDAPILDRLSFSFQPIREA